MTPRYSPLGSFICGSGNLSLRWYPPIRATVFLDPFSRWFPKVFSFPPRWAFIGIFRQIPSTIRRGSSFGCHQVRFFLFALGHDLFSSRPFGRAIQPVDCSSSAPGVLNIFSFCAASGADQAFSRIVADFFLFSFSLRSGSHFVKALQRTGRVGLLRSGRLQRKGIDWFWCSRILFVFERLFVSRLFCLGRIRFPYLFSQRFSISFLFRKPPFKW